MNTERERERERERGHHACVRDRQVSGSRGEASFSLGQTAQQPMQLVSCSLLLFLLESYQIMYPLLAVMFRYVSWIMRVVIWKKSMHE